jgi:hypothetical protein
LRLPARRDRCLLMHLARAGLLGVCAAPRGNHEHSTAHAALSTLGKSISPSGQTLEALEPYKMATPAHVLNLNFVYHANARGVCGRCNFRPRVYVSQCVTPRDGSRDRNSATRPQHTATAILCFLLGVRAAFSGKCATGESHRRLGLRLFGSRQHLRASGELQLTSDNV